MITTIVFDHNDGNSTDYYYDKLGNRKSVVNGGTTNYTRNRLNQYTSVGGTTLHYDLNGNLTQYGTWRYFYDCENRLTDVNFVTTKKMHCDYDYLSRRVSKTTGTVTTKFCYDGDQIIAEYNSSGTLLKKYIYGPGIDEPICMIVVNGGETKYYYHFDGLGSVIALSDVNAAIVVRYSYNVFGQPNAVGASGNRFMFTGREYDNEYMMGLYYYRARYYKPSIGRFLQKDPNGYDDGLNLYTYVGNNPIMRIDPFGLATLSECHNICNAMHSACVSSCSWGQILHYWDPTYYIKCWWECYARRVDCYVMCADIFCGVK